MAPLTLPQEFQSSLLNFIAFPENLPLSTTTVYASTLKDYKTRLDNAQNDLFVTDEELIEVPYREFDTASGEALDKLNIHTSTKLIEWLGVEEKRDLNDSTKKAILNARGRDPKCRFIYLYGQSSRSELKITRQMLSIILTYHQVMPAYLDFVFAFGAQSDPRDLRFSGFQEQTMLKSPQPGIEIPELGRSGRQFQLCYNLKGVTLKKSDPENFKLDDWSIRQAAIHHQFDIVFGTTLWIVTKGNKDLQQRFKELTGTDGRLEDKSFGTVESCFRASLSAHLLYSHWSTEGWRWYIAWLEKVIESESVMAVIGPRGPGYAHKEYLPHDIQDLQYWQDRTNEVVMVLEANIDVLGSLRQFYIGLRELTELPREFKEKCDDCIATFASRIENDMHYFKMQISRAKLLARIISDRKGLISQHLQSQVVERTERLSRNMEREAIVMRIITIVTLLYLPATFVSTFFSTDVVKYQNQNESTTFSDLALQRWLEVTLPLTAVTLFVAWGAYERAKTMSLQGQGGDDRRLIRPPEHKLPFWHLRGRKASTLPLHEKPSMIAKRWSQGQLVAP